jgi:hypothetical protein
MKISKNDGKLCVQLDTQEAEDLYNILAYYRMSNGFSQAYQDGISWAVLAENMFREVVNSA